MKILRLFGTHTHPYKIYVKLSDGNIFVVNVEFLVFNFAKLNHQVASMFMENLISNSNMTIKVAHFFPVCHFKRIQIYMKIPIKRIHIKYSNVLKLS